MTRGERIRHMTDKQIAQYIFNEFMKQEIFERLSIKGHFISVDDVIEIIEGEDE